MASWRPFTNQHLKRYTFYIKYTYMMNSGESLELCDTAMVVSSLSGLTLCSSAHAQVFLIERWCALHLQHSRPSQSLWFCCDIFHLPVLIASATWLFRHHIYPHSFWHTFINLLLHFWHQNLKFHVVSFSISTFFYNIIFLIRSSNLFSYLLRSCTCSTVCVPPNSTYSSI